MKTHTEMRDTVLFYAVAAVTVLGLVVVFGLIALEVYVRWTANQSFTFLGGGELAALTVSTFALLYGLLRTTHVCGSCAHCTGSK